MKSINLLIRKAVVVNDRMQHGYRYELVRPMGRSFAPDFRPQLTPKQMLRLGVFGGKYMTDCRGEFPAEWFEGALLSTTGHDPALNCFGVGRTAKVQNVLTSSKLLIVIGFIVLGIASGNGHWSHFSEPVARSSSSPARWASRPSSSTWPCMAACRPIRPIFSGSFWPCSSCTGH